jgi:hypothetical protein
VTGLWHEEEEEEGWRMGEEGEGDEGSDVDRNVLVFV